MVGCGPMDWHNKISTIADKVIAIDMNEQRLKFAGSDRADYILKAGDSTIEQVTEITDGVIDVVFDASGNKFALSHVRITCLMEEDLC